MFSLIFRRQKIINRSNSVDLAEKREQRVLIQMSVIVLAFLLLWLPYWTSSIAVHFCTLFFHEVLQIVFQNEIRAFPEIFSNVAFQECGLGGNITFLKSLTILQWLGYSNSMVNPFLYTVFNREFRTAFVEIFTGKFT